MRHACFCGLCLLAAAVCHQSLILVAASSLTLDAYALFAFVPPVSLGLIWIERRRIFSESAYWPHMAAGYVLWIAALFWSSTLHAASLSILLLSASCIAAFGLCYGRASLAKAAFPLTLLLAMAPLPDRWLDGCVVLLQNGSATATAWLFSLARIPFTREGLVFALPKLDIEIAKECSGIRSSLILLICGLVLGHLFLKSPWTKLTLALAVVPVTIAKNGLRIFTLSVLGMYVDPSFSIRKDCTVTAGSSSLYWRLPAYLGWPSYCGEVSARVILA